MTIYTRYFRVTGGPLMTKAAEIEAANKVARKAITDFCSDIGAEASQLYSDGRFSGFTFAAAPDMTAWKQPNKLGHYWPRKTSAAGKALLARIETLPRIVPVKMALKVVGLSPDLPVVTHENRWTAPTLAGLADLGELFVCVPWRDEDPEKLAAYKAGRKAGKAWSMELDHLCWEPTADLVEVKRWEVEKALEDLNAKIKARNAMAAAVATAAEVQP